MSAANFGSSIFDKIYSIGLGYQDEETGEYMNDYEFEKDYLQEALEALPEFSDNAHGHRVRNGEVLGMVTKTVEIAGAVLDVDIVLCLGYGYYEGAWLDGVLYVDGQEYRSIDDIDADECEAIYYNNLWDWYLSGREAAQCKGMAKMQRCNLQKRIEAAYNELLQTVQAAASPATTKLVEAYRGSNGETGYTMVQ